MGDVVQEPVGMWNREPFWKDLVKLKRFGRLVALATLYFGGLMGLCMTVFFGTFFCPDLSLECLQDFADRFLWLCILMPTLAGLAFGAFAWILLEWQDSWLLPALVTEIPQQRGIQGGEQHASGAAKIKILHTMSVLERLIKTIVDRTLIVFIDGEPYAAMPFGESAVFTLPPGKYGMYVGFENHKSLWKRCHRTETVIMDLEPGQNVEFSFRRHPASEGGVIAMSLGILLLMATNRLWEPHILQLLEPYLQVPEGIGLYVGAGLTFLFLLVMFIGIYKPGGIYHLVQSAPP